MPEVVRMHPFDVYDILEVTPEAYGFPNQIGDPIRIGNTLYLEDTSIPYRGNRPDFVKALKEHSNA